MYIQRDPGGLAQGFVDLDLDNSPGLWAATVATYCTIRMVWWNIPNLSQRNLRIRREQKTQDLSAKKIVTKGLG